MKKLFTALFFVFLFTGISIGQEYKSAIGGRVGVPLLASYKFFISDPGAIELMAGAQFFGLSNFSTFTVAGAYLHHFPIGDIDGFEWYVGGGAGVNFWIFNSNFIGDEAAISIGANAYGGVSYTFADIPLNLTLDIRPGLHFSGVQRGFDGGGSLGVRYILNR